MNLDESLYQLGSVEGIDKELRLFAVFCARQSQSWNSSIRVSNAIEVAERFAFGNATTDELSSAFTETTEAILIARRSKAGFYLSRAAEFAAYAAQSSCCSIAHEAAKFASESSAVACSFHSDNETRKQAYKKSMEKQKQKFIELFC